MLRVSPSMGQMVEMNTTLRHLLFLLEYCMVTGYDWWDVLLHVQPTMVHNLVERLHEEYMRQNQALQQVRRSRGSPGRDKKVWTSEFVHSKNGFSVFEQTRKCCGCRVFAMSCSHPSTENLLANQSFAQSFGSFGPSSKELLKW